MGPQPVVKRFTDGTEAVYIVARGGRIPVSDGRWDATLGEMVLDDATVPGFLAGYVRFIDNTFFPTDEMANVSAADDVIFGGHWMFGLAHGITDMSPARGAAEDPIQTSDLPHIVASQDPSMCAFNEGHWCPDRLVQDGDSRELPPGFFIYHGQGTVYDRFWSEYAVWVVSNDTVYYRSSDGAVVALEHGDPEGGGGGGRPATPEASSAATGEEEAAAPRAISWLEARDHAGSLVTVEAVVRTVVNNGKAVFIGFKKPHRGALHIQIPKRAWKSFGKVPGEIFHAGDTIRVTGRIKWYQGDPVIVVLGPGQAVCP